MRVLIIEDDEGLQGALKLAFERAGFMPIVRGTGRDGIRAFHEHRPAAVVLDVGLPDISGWEILERIRDMSEVPILLLTARSLEAEKVRGLQAGADDYLTKPFGNAELIARVQAMLRRQPATDESPDRVIEDEQSGLRMELGSRRVTVGGEPVELTQLEWRLLKTFAENAGRVMSPEQLLELAWRDPLAASPGRVKFAVRRLRQKLGPAGERIVTVRGFGYRF